MNDRQAIPESDFDGVALKPTEVDIERVNAADFGSIVIDYEGREHVPAPTVLRDLARETTVRLTMPVRADGFDPLGDDGRSRALPASVGRILVAGNPAYLTDSERRRAVAPRLGAARTPTAWVGTEGVERLALAGGGTQFELLAPTTAREVRALRAAGFDGTVAVYAPVVFDDDENAHLDALGEYVARRGPVAAALDDMPRDAPDETATDATATGRFRSVLLEAIDDFALVGSPTRVDERIHELRSAGVDIVIGYPARDGPSLAAR